MTPSTRNTLCKNTGRKLSRTFFGPLRRVAALAGAPPLLGQHRSQPADTLSQPVIGFQVAPGVPSSPRVHSIFVRSPMAAFLFLNIVVERTAIDNGHRSFTEWSGGNPDQYQDHGGGAGRQHDPGEAQDWQGDCQVEIAW